MNVFEKLQTCRVKLQESNLNKSGENKYAGYKYFELQDFLPKINELFLEQGLFSQVSFTNEFATLKIYNIEKKDEVIEFTSPMAEANLKGCHEIQNLGAVETYQRRYLYMTALEIVEHDALDKTHDKNESPRGLSDKQVNRLFAIAKSKGFSPADVKKAIMKLNKTEAKELTKQEYDALINRIEGSNKQPEPPVKTLPDGSVDPNDPNLPF